MIIDRIILRNFKRFRSQEIRFRDGITGILGNNGTGKSSIVEAIFFALYGVQATGIQPDYIVSSFAGQKEKCEVRLDFRVGGEEYTVLRTFRKGKSVQHDATFHRTGKLMATGVSQVATGVERVLGMGPVDFRNTVYAAQKDLLTLLENTPGKRKDWFLRALGIDYLKTESDRLLKDRIDTKGRELQLIEGELAGLVARQDPGRLMSLEESVQSVRSALRDLAGRIDEFTEKKRGIARQMHDFQEKKTEYTRLAERQEAISADIESTARQKDSIAAQITSLARQEDEHRCLGQELAGFDSRKISLDSLRKQKADFDRLMAENRFLKGDCAALRARLSREKAKIGVLDSEASRLVLLRRSIRDALQLAPGVPDEDMEKAVLSSEADLNMRIGALSGRISQLISDRRQLVSDWNAIKNAGPQGRCPLCHQMLGSHFGRIEDEFSSRLDQVQEEALRSDEEKGLLEDDKERIRHQKPALDEIRGIVERQKARPGLEAEIQDYARQLAGKETDQMTLSGRIQALGFDQAQYDSVAREVAELELRQARFIDIGRNIAHGAALKAQIADLENRILERKGELGRILNLIEQSHFDPGTGTLLEQELAGIDSAIRSGEAERARMAERLQYIQLEIVRLKHEEDAIRGLREKKNVLEEEAAFLGLTRSLIGEYVIYLMQVVRSRLEGEVSRIISEITGGRYDQVIIDEDFNLLVRDIDNDYPVDRFSGGEQDDIAVALRIALSRYLAELHQVHESTFLIFDEIFGSQDEERRANLLNALRTQESRFPQIILISHIPDIQGEFSNTLVVEMGTDLASSVREAA